ncbi:MAG: type I-E CRISPR-associated protein Cas5/CasD [Rhodospirillales bacterium]|nr:MAG: type I-E CRISPR-associated protein Cas5/CasD [Rhodospirillales bacterium]
MPTVLMFTLQAPIAAMGDLAVGERRYGADRLAKSAVLGLLAAALGIDRSDEQVHATLARDYGCAVRLVRGSFAIADYHTVQVPPARKGRRWATRRDELEEPDLGTTVTQREYRGDVHSVVALWGRSGEPLRFSLSALERALRTPVFTLYFGRKSCPLGRPPFPMVLDAATLADAFAAYESADKAKRLGRGAAPDGPIYADVDARSWLGEAVRDDRIISRRDAILSRRRWQFGLRQEVAAVATGGTSGKQGGGG